MSTNLPTIVPKYPELLPSANLPMDDNGEYHYVHFNTHRALQATGLLPGLRYAASHHPKINKPPKKGEPAKPTNAPDMPLDKADARVLHAHRVLEILGRMMYSAALADD